MEENGKKNGKTNGSESSDLERIAEENRKMVDEKKNGNGSTKAEATNGKTEKAKAVPKKSGEGKKGKADKQKVAPFTAKPVPEAVKGLVVSIQKVTDLENLKAVARALQKHWKGVYLEACKKATEGFKAGNVVWFKKGSKLIEGKVIKIKSNGKVKIDVEGKNWKVPGTLVHKGKPTGANRAEATGSEVTKKAA
jgi:hypothetical protein